MNVYNKPNTPLYIMVGYNEIKNIIKTEIDNANKITKGAGKHKIKIALIECGFDIETTRINDERTYMYHWQLSLNDYIITGRKWSDFSSVITLINMSLKKHNSHCYIFVANLGYEFQFLRKHFEITDLFARENRHPINFKIDRCIFLDALSITGGNLENLAKNYCSTKKLVGDLDYSLIRNSKTELTQTELDYCINDVVILQEFANYLFTEYLLKQGYLPITQTGIVRQQMRLRYKGNKKHYAYIQENYLSRTQYNTFSRFLFRGGYVHANAEFVNQTITGNKVASVDFTSSYPAVMNQKYYPITKFKEIKIKNFDNLDKNKCYVLAIDFYNISATTSITIESLHKLVDYDKKSIVLDNGRLFKCDKVRVYLTEIDLKIYKHFYKWEKYTILKCWESEKGQLPFELLENLNSWYIKKSELKKAGLDGTLDYTLSKQFVNSHYGMCVTNLAFDEITYSNDEWQEPTPTTKNYKQLICKEFLLYQWGIYITAHARYNLLSNVAKMENVIYCDTDSIYFLDSEKNRNIVTEYNKKVLSLNKKIFDNENLHDLGLFDYQPQAIAFKTLGCKRYIYTYEKNNEIKLKQTIAGLPKKTLETWKKENNKTFDDVFNFFNTNMCINSKYSNKLTSCYNDNEHTDIVTDYQGNTEYMTELSGITLNNSDYNLTLNENWIDFLMENFKIHFKRAIEK